ncbi:MAG: hypothetical protein J7L66_00810 [Anaerolineaceae bacterium]|nr:hypothetical protein [Anaerolineaceae bacterium]
MVKQIIGKVGLVYFLISTLILSACREATTSQLVNSESTQTSESATDLKEDKSADAKLVDELNEGLPPEPIEMELTTSDGVTLDGTFYPAEEVGAPLVILMHWARGDQYDWVEIAYWLQNRGLGNVSINSDQAPWLDMSWFPEIGVDKSFNVFTFTFRNCEGGCKSFKREKWYRDVQAVAEFALGLQDIDKDNIIMIGASIGSDGAVDGCAYLNQVYEGACKGAFSFSPGNYLTIDYIQMVTELSPVPVWCLYAESDQKSAAVCGNISEENFLAYSYRAGEVFADGHGMNLISPEMKPNPLELIISFIEKITK